jgi:endonuclease/exonuclease/phosphatase family metal-dependent hydrolase
MRKSGAIRIIEATTVALFFVQAVRVLFSVLFGVIYDALFVGPFSLSAAIIILLMVAAFLAPALAPRNPRRRFALMAAVLVFLVRVPMTLNDPQLRLYASLLAVASGGLYAASLLRTDANLFSTSWILALALDQLFRTLGDTFDITLRPGWLIPQIALSALLCWLAFVASRRASGEPHPARLGFLGGVALGAVLFLETSLLSLPNALARWSGWSYEAVAPLLALVTLLPLGLNVQGGVRWPHGRARLWGLLLVLASCIGLAYGFGHSGLPSAMGLLIAQWAVLCSLGPSLGMGQESGERVGPRLALGFLFFVLINFANAFAFTYPYTLELFRGAGLPVFVSAGLVATLPAALRGFHLPEMALAPRRGWLAGAMLLFVAWIALSARPPVVSMGEAGSPLRVGTYNIHYGYNTHWNLTLEEIAQTIEQSGADIVALQEVDTGRITSYCVDDALWLGRRLHMGALYLPTVEHLTGIGLLYRFPLEEAEGKLLTSQLEQTGVLRARLQVGEEPLTAYGIWLGLEPDERAVQIREALEWVTPGAAVFGGDMNSTPDEQVYARMQEAGFDDPFVMGGFDPAFTDPAEGPNKRIDYVWTRGLVPTDARVLESLASDHRMVVIEGRWE